MESAVVAGREFPVEVIARIQQTVQEQPDLSRAMLSRLVCQWLNWRQPTGKWREMSCRVALRKLAQRKLIALPAPRSARPARKAIEQSQLLRDCEKIECELKELGSIELVAVRGRQSEESRLWKEMVAWHHYAGYQPLVGAQMRYLIRCRKGWVGALGFSAAARQVAARDRFIGWSVRARRVHREEVVANSRFLLLPWVKVRNLASKVLALCVKSLAADWQRSYGYRPLLVESYVDRERFRGTCYRAANWIYVGRTAGRGRQDRECRPQRSVKDIYLYPLSADWQRRLCREPLRKPQRSDGELAQGSWARQEFSATPCDRRLHRRVVLVAEDFYAKPQANIAQACGSRAKTKAAYRLFSHRKLSLTGILASHAASTVERMRAHRVVLAVQDTTTLNYSTQLATEGLGPIGYRKDRGQGLVVHDTVAFSPEGVALGVLDVQVWARDEREFGKKALRKKRSIEQKESRKWLISFEAAAAAQHELPDTVVVSVGDREADVYELFELAHSRADHPKLLVRAEHDRLLADGQGHLWAAVEGQPIVAEQEVRVPARRARGNQAAQPPRTARLAIRFAAVELKSPNRPGLSALCCGPCWQRKWRHQQAASHCSGCC